MGIKLWTVSSLEKVFPKKDTELIEDRNSAVVGEQFVFQCVVNSDVCQANCKIEILSNGTYEIFSVGNVPSNFSLYDDHDDYVIDENCGLFPDVLYDYKGDNFNLSSNVNKVFLIKCKPCAVGEMSFEIILKVDGQAAARKTYLLEIIEQTLVKNDLKITNWFHYDCICNFHRCKAFSNKFYKILKRYIECACAHGQNMLYIPIFTPPIDTQINGERTTVQSVKVDFQNGKYTFDFSQFDKLVELSQACGIEYFELSHLTTQWGAEFCPKIIANSEIGKRQIFGWNTSSESSEYITFLKEFLGQLHNRLKKLNILNKTFIHISDEPKTLWIDRYERIKNTIKEVNKDFQIIDALSEYEFCKRKCVDVPVVCIGEEGEFIKNNADFFVYYCCVNYKNYHTNRLFNSPILRTRILGIQLYLAKAKGFLHWGYNFYNSRLSTRSINPYYESDADGWFPSGDSYVVYPAKEGVNSSIRHEAFYAAINDYLKLKTLETKIRRASVVKFLNDNGYYNFSDYNKDSKAFINFNNELNKKLQNRF